MMNSQEITETITANLEQEDPCVMYLVVRETLQMSVGKVGAQIGHAVQLLLEDYYSMCSYPELRSGYTDEEIKKIESYELWRKTSYRKVTLKANDKEWIKVKDQLPKDFYIVVIDNGLTEIPAGSETVIGVYPMLKSKRPKILKRLQALE